MQNTTEKFISQVEMIRSKLEQDPGKPRILQGLVRAYLALVSAQRNGFVYLPGVRKVLDFGAGYGGPTRALTLLMPNAVVEAAEINPWIAAEILHFKIIPLERLHGDGQTHLRSLRNNPCAKYDLITAFMFSPEPDLFEQFLQNGQRALLPNGQLLLTSDREMFGFMTGYCNDQRVDFSVNNGIFFSNSAVIPATLHIRNGAL